MGKSREAAAAFRNLRSQDALADLVAVGGRSDPQKSLLGLLQNANATAWRDTGEPWHLFIDGLDEAFGGAGGFEPTLQTFLEALSGSGGDLARMRLRLLCRTVEWSPALDRLIATYWAEGEIGKRQIGPLSQGDVVQAVDTITGNSEAAARFIDQVSKNGAQALASRPVSLKLLTDLQRQHGALPAGQAELYRLGLEALADEPDESRRKRVRRGALDRREKLTVAARIAAATAFSGITKIWVGFESHLKPEDAFALAEIAGGVEPAPPESFPVSDADLLDALRTPLFVPFGAETYGWVHQTFMEYLAARYLTDHGMAAREVMTFLSVAEPEGVRGIAPQWREIAAWVATMSKPFFDLLMAAEPDVLLQSDVSVASADDREQLVEAILTRLDAGELVDIYFGLRPLLGRLSHPRLSAQLRAFVSDPEKGVFARRGAIDIIEENHLSDLATDLAKVALSRDEPLIVRTDAAYAVYRLGDAAAQKSLAPLLQRDLAEDVDDELRGAVLLSLWPADLTFQELLPALTPEKRTNLIGSYHMFLRQLELGKLSATDAIAAIAWLREQLPDRPDDDGLKEVLAKVFWAAAQLIRVPEVRAAIASFVVDSFDTLANWIFETTRDVPPAWRDDAGDRLALVRLVLEAAAQPEQAARTLSYSLPGLVTPDDLALYLDALVAEGDGALGEALTDIVATLAYRQPIDDLTEVFTAAEKIPSLQNALLRLFFVETDSQSAKWMRDSLRRERDLEVRAAERAKAAQAADKRVKDALTEIEAGSADDWWHLNLQLFVSASGSYEAGYEFKSDLTATPGWARLTLDDQTRVTDAGLRYLTEARLRTLRWLGTNTQHRPASAAIRAFRLLLETRPAVFAALPDTVWRTWGAATISFFDNDFTSAEAAQVEILRKAYSTAPDAVLRAVARMALGPKSQGLSQRALQLLEEIFDPRLAAFLEKLRHRTGVKVQPSEGGLFAFLVRMGHLPALTELNERLDADDGDAATGEDDAPSEDDIAGAAAVRMAAGDIDMWRRVMALGARSPEVSRAIWTRYASGSLFRRGRRTPSLPADLVADAYLELKALFPEPPSTDTARFLSAVDYVDQLQSGLLEDLVNRGTAEAVAAVSRLQRTLPDLAWLGHRLQEARRNYRAAARRLYSPGEVVTVLAGFQPALPLRNDIDAAQAAIALDSPPTVVADAVPTTRDEPLPAEQTGKAPSTRRPLKILAVATEWRSGHGGVSTLNRELCIALAAQGHEVCCVALDVTAEDRLVAAQQGVQLVLCPEAVGFDGATPFLTLRPRHLDGFAPDVVIGHDHVTGPAALQVAEEFGAAYVHVLHTVPRASEGLKVPRGQPNTQPMRGHEKAEAQLKVARAAKLLVGVGPKIVDEAYTCMPTIKRVHELIPGLNPALLGYRADLNRLRRPWCLMSARMEDAALKGAKIACNAVKSAGGSSQGASRPRLILRGFTPDKAGVEFAAIGDLSDYQPFVDLRPYTDNVDEMNGDVQSASLVMMPSLSEGFGLSGFEAIAAGVPVVLSSESGLAEYLLKAIEDGKVEPEIRDNCIARVNGDNDAQIDDEWAGLIAATMADRAEAFRRAERLRAALQPILTWSAAAESLVTAIWKALDAEDPA